MSKNDDFIKARLIRLLNHYLSDSKIQIRHVFKSALNRLIKHGSITEKQFSTIIKFIEREKDFNSMNRLEIWGHFNHLINNTRYTKESVNANADLTSFFETC